MGQAPPLHLRWLSPQPPARRAASKITASRLSLCGVCADFERFDLPDPLSAWIPGWRRPSRIARSTIPAI
jgi:hypothetical protein